MEKKCNSQMKADKQIYEQIGKMKFPNESRHTGLEIRAARSQYGTGGQQSSPTTKPCLLLPLTKWTQILQELKTTIRVEIAVSKVICPVLDNLHSIPSRGRNSTQLRPDRVWGRHKNAQRVSGVLCPEEKRPGLETDHLPSSSDEVKNFFYYLL